MKPKDILVVTTHSFVDLITNSSSELFVANGKKTIDAIKELLVILLKNHDALMGTQHEFDNVFGKIERPEYVFDFWAVSPSIKEECAKYKEYGCSYYRNVHFDSSERPEEMTALMGLEYEMRKKHNSWEEGISDKEKKRRSDACDKDEDVLWTDWGVRAFRSEMALFREFLKQNKFDEETLLKVDRKVERTAKQHRKENGGRYLYPKFTGIIRTAWDTFSMYEGYGIQAKADSVIIHSASDNTIPYEMMETISAYLNADRFHIG